jgi:hypothetical protein
MDTDIGISEKEFYEQNGVLSILESRKYTNNTYYLTNNTNPQKNMKNKWVEKYPDLTDAS